MVFLKQFTFLRLQQIQLFCTKYISRNPALYKQQVIRDYREKYGELLSKPDIPEGTWKEIREDMLNSTNVREVAVDSFILSTCQTIDFMHAGVQYYRILESCGKPSVIITAGYLSLYEYKRDPINDVEKEHILEIYKEISSKYKLLHADLASSCIMALAKLGDIEECIKIIDQFEKYEKTEFLAKGYNALLLCLLEQEKIDLVHKYMTITCTKSTGPFFAVYEKYIKYCMKDKQSFDTKIERIFTLWEEYGITPCEQIIKAFIDACNKHGWSAKFTHLHRSICVKCKMKTLESDITEKQYKALKESIMEKLIVEKGYQISHPRERNSFIKFLDNNGPYDVVIDALNVIYTRINKNTMLNLDSLANVLEYVHKDKKKTLVIGKSYLKRFSQLEVYKQMADFYFLDNRSMDDQFALYATVSSGKNTILISNDFMRQHKFVLDNFKLGLIFRKWQHSHQYTWNMKENKVNLRPLSGSARDIRHSINSGAQKTQAYWHIPYAPTHSFCQQYSVDWACFRMPHRLTEI